VLAVEVDISLGLDLVRHHNVKAMTSNG